MKNAAVALLVIGLVLGTMSVASGIVTLVFADRLNDLVTQGLEKSINDSSRITEGLRRATDRSIGHILDLAARLAVVAAGGALGLVAVSRRRGAARFVLGSCTIAAGLGLFGLHMWVSAAAFLVGGLLIVLAPAEKSGAPR
jgi:hypothetical protein